MHRFVDGMSFDEDCCLLIIINESKTDIVMN